MKVQTDRACYEDNIRVNTYVCAKSQPCMWFGEGLRVPNQRNEHKLVCRSGQDPMRSISQALLGQVHLPSRSRLFRKRASNALHRRWSSTASCLVEDSKQHIPISRRLLGTVAFGAVINIAELTCFAPPGGAVMGMTAGRVPGLAPADANGIRRYTRPEGKSGGHGVGWTEITPYFFDVYEGWEEVPVSIADPGGTEIDVKFYSDNDGGLKVVLAPVLRFANVEEGTNPTIEELIPFERFMAGFGPELTQNPVTDEDIVDKFVDTRGILTYYNFELRDHTLVSATVWKKRVYIVCLKAPARQWRSSAQKLRDTMKSFTVLTDMT